MQDFKIVNRSELIKAISDKYTNLPHYIVVMAITHIFETMTNALMEAKKIELRKFGSFSLQFRPARLARNPKTGNTITMRSKYAVHFKPGKELHAKVNKKF
jgi:integration host factor subunit beta